MLARFSKCACEAGTGFESNFISVFIFHIGGNNAAWWQKVLCGSQTRSQADARNREADNPIMQLQLIVLQFDMPWPCAIELWARVHARAHSIRLASFVSISYCGVNKININHNSCLYLISLSARNGDLYGVIDRLCPYCNLFNVILILLLQNCFQTSHDKNLC